MLKLDYIYLPPAESLRDYNLSGSIEANAVHGIFYSMDDIERYIRDTYVIKYLRILGSLESNGTVLIDYGSHTNFFRVTADG